MKKPLLAFAALLSACAVGAGNAPSDGLAVERGWLGAYLESPAPEGDPARADGVGVVGIVEGSPAEEAGLRASDRIVAVDGVAVRVAAEAIAEVRRLHPDAWVSLSILRGSDPLDLSVRLGSAPPDTAHLTLAKGWIGVAAIDLPPSLRQFFGAPPDRGVLVSEVEAGSPGESAGIEIGDVLYEISGAPVRFAGELSSRISAGGIGNEIEIAVARSGKNFTVESLVAKEPTRED